MHETSCSDVKDIHCFGEVIVNGVHDTEDKPGFPAEAQACTAEMNGWGIQKLSQVLE